MKLNAAAILVLTAMLAAGMRTAADDVVIVPVEELFTDATAGRRVTVEGIVQRAQKRPDGRMVLRIRTRFAQFQATLADVGTLTPKVLEDSKIRVTGRAKPIYTPAHEVYNVDVQAEGPEDVKILEPAPPNPFAIRETKIANLRTATGDDAPLRRHRVRGVVTFSRPDEPYLFMREDERNLRVALRGRNVFQKGDLIDAVGFIDFKSTTSRMEDALARKTGEDRAALPQPRPTTVADLRAAPEDDGKDWFGEPVKLTGHVYDVNRRETYLQLGLDSTNGIVFVTIPLGAKDPMPKDLKAGAVIELEGIVSMNYILWPQESRTIADVTVNVEGPQDVHVVTKAPWWTPGKVMILLGILAAVAGGALLWAAQLRRAVARQARKLEATIRMQHDAKLEADAVRRERLRLSHDLHDGFQQLLAGSMFRIKAAMNYLPDGADKAREQLLNAQQSLTYTQNGLRTALWGLMEESEGPADLTGLFRYAAGRMAHWQGIVHVVSTGYEPPLARHLTGGLLMILQEAVGNALRHGHATDVQVRVDFGPNDLTMTIADNGSGFDPAAVPKDGTGHFGLTGMRERAGWFGGAFRVESAPGKGTTVTVHVNLKKLPPAPNTVV